MNQLMFGITFVISRRSKGNIEIFLDGKVYGFLIRTPYSKFIDTGFAAIIGFFDGETYTGSSNWMEPLFIKR